jgi:hypothetical protein
MEGIVLNPSHAFFTWQDNSFGLDGDKNLPFGDYLMKEIECH